MTGTHPPQAMVTPFARLAAMMSSQPLLVFDGDDTLWESEVLYDRARERAARVVEAAGLDPVGWDKLQRRIDVENVRTSLGLSAQRFPTSCRQAYEGICAQQGLNAVKATADHVYRVASAVFQAKAALMPDAEKVLRSLYGTAALVLLTRGDRFVQERRVKDSGLEPYFDCVSIVERKTPATFVELGGRFKAARENSWSIGNSLASDINPALRAGWRAVWIDAHVWEYERRETEAVSDVVVVVDRLGALLERFGKRPENESTNLSVKNVEGGR